MIGSHSTRRMTLTGLAIRLRDKHKTTRNIEQNLDRAIGILQIVNDNLCPVRSLIGRPGGVCPAGGIEV